MLCIMLYYLVVSHTILYAIYHVILSGGKSCYIVCYISIYHVILSGVLSCNKSYVILYGVLSCYIVCHISCYIIWW